MAQPRQLPLSKPSAMKQADLNKGESSSKKRQARGNAFEMLMQKRQSVQKGPSALKSRFVACPAGCGRHVREQDINEHLDRCLGSIEAVGVTRSEAKTSEQVANVDRDVTRETTEPVTFCPTPARSSSSSTISPESDNADNVFSHMMKQSQRVFSTKESQPIRQCFHLHPDGRLTWTCTEYVADPGSLASENMSVHWSAKVLLKASRMVHGQPQPSPDASQPHDVELTVSTAMVSSGTSPPRRLVRKHSRLSVPVLKSILQKSIRRRRPLPSVRVAMELMDKALGELLRRLPIIMLEDSMLHPDFPLLVWLMVAESKDYVVPPQLVIRVLQIVYEMASCPWTDLLGDDLSNTIAEDKNDQILLSSPVPWADGSQRSDECDLLLRSILLRAQYGGMAGDMQMLHDYVRLWFKRIQDVHVSSDVVERVSQMDKASASPSTERSSELRWCDVPSAIHARAKSQSQSHVNPVAQHGLEKLSMKDICFAGVDFHCSSVLDQAIADDAVFEVCYERLSSIVARAGLSPLPVNEDQRRPYMMRVLKKCMWKFSSATNLRRSLLTEAPKEVDQQEVTLKIFWNENMASLVDSYMKKYVEDRLAR